VHAEQKTLNRPNTQDSIGVVDRFLQRLCGKFLECGGRGRDDRPVRHSFKRRLVSGTDGVRCHPANRGRSSWCLIHPKFCEEAVVIREMVRSDWADQGIEAPKPQGIRVGTTRKFPLKSIVLCRGQDDFSISAVCIEDIVQSLSVVVTATLELPCEIIRDGVVGIEDPANDNRMGIQVSRGVLYPSGHELVSKVHKI
jgi:hypothetical protein